MENNRFDGKIDLALTDEEYSQLRNQGINVGITLPNGHSYISIGGGINCAGGCAMSVILTNRFIHDIKDIYRQLKGDITLDVDETFPHSDDGQHFKVYLGLKNDNQLFFYIPGTDLQWDWLEFQRLPR